MVLAAVAVNVPVVAAFVIRIPAGTVRFGLLLPIATVLQPTDGLFNVTVHVLGALAPRIVGLQLTEAGTTAATRLMVKTAELLPRVAVTIADWLLETVVVVALNVAVVAAAATVTDAGTVSVVFVFVSVTFAPPVGATLVNVTVQVLEAFCPRLVGLQESEDTMAGATRLMVALAEVLLYVAVTVAL
jgi:hypothetical protein